MSALQSLAISETNRREAKRFIKFAMVGIAGTITHLTIANLLNFGFHFPDALANSLGFITAVFQNFALNYRWTFRDKRNHKSRWVQAGQFMIVSFVGLGINAVVREIASILFTPFWHSVIHNPTLADVVSYNFSIAVAIGVVLFWNFVVNRLWTFRGS